MNKSILSLAVAGLAFAHVSFATPITVNLVNDGTQGMYVNLGEVLDGTSSMFPLANSFGAADPTLDIPAGTPPNLSAASAQLGNWLANPAAPGGAWVGPQGIPAGWAVNSETAIIYTLNSADNLTDVIASFGVDNGIYLWVDGVFKGGSLRPGGAETNEHVFNIGSLSGGTHYLQVLREDHGGGTGYTVNVSGTAEAVPEPSSLALLGLGTLGLAFLARRRKA